MKRRLHFLESGDGSDSIWQNRMLILWDATTVMHTTGAGSMQHSKEKEKINPLVVWPDVLIFKFSIVGLKVSEPNIQRSKIFS